VEKNALGNYRGQSDVSDQIQNWNVKKQNKIKENDKMFTSKTISRPFTAMR